MFEHSVKVPRHYKVAANIVKEVSTKGGSVKTLLYDDKLRHFKTNLLYALITETIKHVSDIDRMFESCSILENEQRLDPWLAKVLTAELLFRKKTFPGKSKPEQTILSYKDQFEKFCTTNQDSLETEVVRRPRYVRVNTNLLTTSDAIGAFQDEGYRFIRCTSGSYNDYLQQIQNLSEYDFTQDYHVKTVFVFPPGTKLHEHDLYLENKIILQDKATTLAVHLLAPEPGSVVLDMCAAPGMKTTQLAASLRNQGKIIAVERNEKRYETLCDFVKKTGSKCVETVHKDALEIRRGEYSDVEYILLDPSCSGSGMELSVHNYIDPTRLAKLTSLQEKFLKHAMNAFPKAKRIVYSTCSILPEENERVVTNVVKTSRARWRVRDVKELLKDQWNNFGSGMYGSMGTRCIYAKPSSDFTIGFFLTVLDRDPKDVEKSLSENFESKSTKINDNNKACNEENYMNANLKKVEFDEIKVSKNKKKKNRDKEPHLKPHSDKYCYDIRQQNENNTKKSDKTYMNSEVFSDTKEDTEINETIIVNTKKKKKKDKKIFLELQEEASKSYEVKEGINEDTEIEEVTVMKNKKKRKKENKQHQDTQLIHNESYKGIEQQDKDQLIEKERFQKQQTNENKTKNVLVAEENGERVKRKKQKNKENSENSDSELLVELEYSKVEDTKKKKKKRHRDVIETESDIQIDVKCSNNAQSYVSKKKKRK